MYLQGRRVHRDPSQGTDFLGYGDSIRRELRRIIANRDYVKVLDVGTGFASNLSFLARLLRKARIWSVDPSEEALRNAHALLKKDGFDSCVSLRKASVESLPFKSGFFDLVTSVMVLHHTNDLSLGARSMMRTLSQQGVLAIIDWKRSASKLPFQVPHPPEIFVSPNEVRRALTKEGAKIQLKNFHLWFSITAKKKPTESQ